MQQSRTGLRLDPRERLVSFYERHNPSKLPNVDATLLKFANREDELFSALARKYGEAVPTHRAPQRPRHAPNPRTAPAPTAPPETPASAPAAPAVRPPGESGIGPVAESPAQADTEWCEDATMVVEEEAAPPEPAGPFSLADRELMADAASLLWGEAAMGADFRFTTFKERLALFYANHNPRKLLDINGTLLKFRGREWVLATALRRKYGEALPQSSPVALPPPPYRRSGS